MVTQKPSPENFEELSYLSQVRRLHGMAKVALSAYGLDTARIRLIRHRENATFQVDAVEGSIPRPGKEEGRYVRGRYLLKIHGPGYQTAAFIASELQWLNALRHETNLAVPEPVSTLDGEQLINAFADGMPGPRICTLLRWMKGRGYRFPRPTHLAAIGEVMAQLHNHTDGWSPPPGFARRQLDWEGLLGKEAGFAVSPQDIWRSLPPRYADLFEAVSEKVRQAMRDLGSGPEVFGLIHADLHTRNIIFSGGETRVIDFDDSGFGHRVYDMAVCLLENGSPDHHDELFRGYARHRAVPRGQLEYLDTFIAARRLSNAVWTLEQPHDDSRTRHEKSLWLESNANALATFLRRR